MPWIRTFATSVLVFACVIAAAGQDQKPPEPPPVTQQEQQPPASAQPSQPPDSKEKAQAPAAEPDKKISPEEAQALFNSLDEILHFASKQTGLPIKHEVKHKLTSRDEVQKFIEKRMKDDPDRKRMEESEFVMKKFGLLPHQFNLSKFMVAMLREQVAGYYDTKTKTMNLLDWLPPEVQKPVMAHELTHALQDQYVDLDKWEDAGYPEGKKLPLPKELELDEARVARQSVTEGQAMLVLIDYSLVPMGSSSAESPEAVKMMEDQMMDGSGSPVFDSAPLYIKRALMFSYREGTEFERQVLVADGKQGAYKGTLDHPPQDTREVMIPASYLRGQHTPLLAVPDYDKVLGHDWKQIDFGALGQFDVNVMMELYSDAETSEKLTSDWRGGYYYAAHRKGAPPEDVAFIYVSRWSDEAAAGNFAKLFASSWKRRYNSLRAQANAEDNNILSKETEEGTVSVERHGSLVIAIESFPQSEAAKLRQAALEADGGDKQTNARLLRNVPAFVSGRFGLPADMVLRCFAIPRP